MYMYVRYVRSFAALGGRFHGYIGVETTGDGCHVSIFIIYIYNIINMSSLIMVQTRGNGTCYPTNTSAKCININRC